MLNNVESALVRFLMNQYLCFTIVNLLISFSFITQNSSNSFQGEFDDSYFGNDSLSLSRPFRLEFEPSQSQILDSDGFLKQDSFTKPKVSMIFRISSCKISVL